MILREPQVAPLIEVFELYMLRDAVLADMREPTIIATRTMLDAGLNPEVILGILEGAVQVAVSETAAASPEAHARELLDNLGPWLMRACFDPMLAHGAAPPAD